jgi:predicted AlkP superfamily phosphohydrolase/phosphomutase
MLGIDAASTDLIRANPARLPNFRRLLDSGPFQSLKSWGDVASGSVWPSFAAGMSPGEHAIYHHIQWNPETMRFHRVSRDWIKYAAFWLPIAEAKKKVCVIDVPTTFPLLNEDSLEIVSWASHDRLFPFSCNRPDIERELRRRFSMDPLGHEIPVVKSQAILHATRDRLVDCARQKGEMVRWLLTLEPWDLFITVFGETHRAGHLLWSPDGDMSKTGPSADLVEIYAAIDEGLGRILDDLDGMNATVVLFAVHGMGRDISRMGTIPFIMDRVNELHHAEVSPSTAPPRQRSLMRYLRQAVPASVQHAIGQAVPVGIRDWVVEQAAGGGYDWSRTPGFSLLADLAGYIRFNLKGREAEGILQSGGPEQQRYTAMIEASLRELVDAKTGQKIVADVIPRSALFSGSRVEFLPDLFVTWRDTEWSDRARTERFGLLPEEPLTGRSGNHTRDGFAVINSPSRDITGLPPLNSVTDLGRWVRAALSDAA